MDDADRHPGAGHADDAAPDPAGDIEAPQSGEGEIEDTLIEEASAIIDDARTYAEAEIAFQKTRAKLAGRLVGASAGLVIVALILLKGGEPVKKFVGLTSKDDLTAALAEVAG